MQGVLEKIITHSIPSSEDHQAVLRWLNEHPYSAALHALNARSARILGDSNFEKIIVSAAIRVNSRKKLHDFIFHEESSSSEIVEKIEIKDESKIKLDSKSNSNSGSSLQTRNFETERVAELDRQLLAEAMSAGAALELLKDLETIEVPKKEKSIEVSDKSMGIETLDIPTEKGLNTENKKMSRSSWMQTLVEPSKNVNSQSLSNQSSNPGFKKTKAIIDHFIDNESSLVPKRAEFFSPAKAAKTSLIDKTDMVSETLANVYAKQGNISKAISTYEKLSLLLPEKSAYFAALIDNLKHNKTT